MTYENTSDLKEGPKVTPGVLVHCGISLSCHMEPELSQVLLSSLSLESEDSHWLSTYAFLRKPQDVTSVLQLRIALLWTSKEFCRRETTLLTKSLSTLHDITSYPSTIAPASTKILHPQGKCPFVYIILFSLPLFMHVGLLPGPSRPSSSRSSSSLPLTMVDHVSSFEISRTTRQKIYLFLLRRPS